VLTLTIVVCWDVTTFSLVEAAWYLRHHVSDDRVAYFIVLRWRWRFNTILPDYTTLYFRRQWHEYFKILTGGGGGCQNPSEDTKMSVCIRLMVP